MTQATLNSVADEYGFKRLTVDQYDRMIDEGILQSGEPYELLDGLLVRKDRSRKGEDPLTVGDDHAWAIVGLSELGPRLARLGCHMRNQIPISIPPLNAPEPDGVIVVGTRDEYKKRKPTAKEITCVIEVADSSLRQDRIEKRRLYANAGIGQYVIINLRKQTIEVYTEPKAGRGVYGNIETVTKADKVTLRAAGGKSLTVAARMLLP